MPMSSWMRKLEKERLRDSHATVFEIMSANFALHVKPLRRAIFSEDKLERSFEQQKGTCNLRPIGAASYDSFDQSW